MLSGVGLLLGSFAGIVYISTKLHDPEASPRRMAIEKELPYTDKYFPPKDNQDRPIFTWLSFK